MIREKGKRKIIGFAYDVLLPCLAKGFCCSVEIYKRELVAHFFYINYRLIPVKLLAISVPVGLGGREDISKKAQKSVSVGGIGISGLEARARVSCRIDLSKTHLTASYRD